MSAVEAHPVLLARNVKFDWRNTPLHWVPNDSFTSHFINVLHLLLPEGELWFCRVYNKALPLITEEPLRSDVKGFIRQEAVHSRSHTPVLEHYAQTAGINSEPYTRRVRWLFTQLLGDHPFGLSLNWQWLERVWLIFRLGLICAIEHYTCIIGKWILESKGLDKAGADPVMLDLLRWHGAEEVEHRAVAHDLFGSVGGGYLQRLLLMLIVGPVLLYLWFSGTRFFMRQDKSAPKKYRFMQEWNRAAAQDRLPSLAMLTSALTRYLRRDFHPVHEAQTQLALDYLATSPAANAALNG